MPSLEQIRERMKKLQEQADALIGKQAQAAVDQIRKIMLTHGLTTQDIEAKAREKRDAKASNGRSSSTKTKLANSAKREILPKYEHPETGATWTGRGRAPVWIATVKDRKKFLIDSSNAVTASNAKPSANGTTVVAETATHKGLLPAKYFDPKTGKSWSGRGPAPAWLASARNKNAFLVEGAEPAKFGAASKKATNALAKTVGKKARPKKTAAKTGQRKGPQPAKYLDPVSGKTWSGRGPAPAWLASEADRSAFLADKA